MTLLVCCLGRPYNSKNDRQSTWGQVRMSSDEPVSVKGRWLSTRAQFVGIGAFYVLVVAFNYFSPYFAQDIINLFGIGGDCAFEFVGRSGFRPAQMGHGGRGGSFKRLSEHFTSFLVFELLFVFVPAMICFLP